MFFDHYFLIDKFRVRSKRTTSFISRQYLTNQCISTTILKEKKTSSLMIREICTCQNRYLLACH